MKTTSLRPAPSAFTLVEVLVVITLIAILVTLFGGLDCGPRVTTRGYQTRALSNAKQIALALALYAGDHDGKFPSYTLHNGDPTTTRVTNSNTAFAQLFPDYVQQEAIFWIAKSAFCSTNPPDEVQDNPPLDTPVNTLKQGENEWACVLGLNDKSNPAFPLLADGFADAVSHKYVTDPARRGGVWKGQKAIVVHVDGSGIVAPVDQATMTVTINQLSMTITGSNGYPGMTGDIFTTAHSSQGWLTPENKVVNPK